MGDTPIYKLYSAWDVVRIIDAVKEDPFYRKRLVILTLVALLYAASALALMVYHPYPPIGFFVGIGFACVSMVVLLCGLFPQQFLRLFKWFETELGKERSTNPGWWVR